MTSRKLKIDQATAHLQAEDPVLRKLIRRVGPFTLKLRRDRFATLACSIISQQISGKAARTITARLLERLEPDKLTPAALARLDIDQLRAVGVSRQKATYLRDLADKALDGTVRFDRFGRMSDEEVIQELILVKGVGRWTAQMLLIFSLGRLDVMPHDDLGIRTAIRNLYGLPELPSKEQCLAVAQPWRPYASVASWYCWRSLDNQ